MTRRFATILALAAAPMAAAGGHPVAMEYDFGIVDEGAVADHLFEIVNTTDQRIALDGFRVSCTSCVTVGPFEFDALGPGERGNVRVQLDTAGKGGPISQWAAISTDNDEIPIFKMTMRGVVRSGWIEPKFAKLDRIGIDETVAVPFALFGAGLETLRIIEITSSRPDLLDATSAADAERHPEERDVVRYATGTIRWRGAHGRVVAGAIVETLFVTVEDERGDRYTIDVPIEGYAVGALDALPTRAFFGRVAPGATRSRTLRLRWSGAPVSLDGLEIETGHPSVAAALESAGDNLSLVVTLTAPASSDTDDLMSGDIVGSIGGEPIFSFPYAAMLARTKDDGGAS